MRSLYGLVCCLAIAAICAMPQATSAQSTAPSPAPSAASSSAPSTGSGGSSLPIESTILAYQGLQAGADAIAQALTHHLQGNSAKLIVATPNDVSAIIALRLVLSEIDLFNERLRRITCALHKVLNEPESCTTQPVKASAPSLPLVAQGLASIATDLGSVLSSVATFTAVNETVAAQPASFLDSTLVNMVAQSVTSATGDPVYVPSLAPPNLINIFPYADNASLEQQTYLFGAIKRLEASRQELEAESDKLLTKANQHDPRAIAAAKLAAAALAASDKFEGALFGMSGIPATSLVTAYPTPKPKDGTGTSKPSTISNTITIAPAKATPSPASSGPGPLQRLLYADLLLHSLGPNSANTYLLAVHALESSGSQYAKSQTLLGTRLYFSGGAVATFVLTKSDGSVACSGIAYGYRGLIRADDFGYAVRPAANATPVVVPGTNNALPSTQFYQPSC